MYFLILFTLITVTYGHFHEIVFLVDNSENINEGECFNKQTGIADYFKSFYDLNVGNVLSYISFNGDSLEKIIDFDDKNENNKTLAELVHKVQHLKCDGGGGGNGVINKMNALKYAISLFRNNTLTPRILLFNSFVDLNSKDTAICDYFLDEDAKNYLDINGNLIKITVVNIFGNGINEDYLICLAGSDEERYFFEFKDASNYTFSLHHDVVIKSVCHSCSGTGYCSATISCPSEEFCDGIHGNSAGCCTLCSECDSSFPTCGSQCGSTSDISSSDSSSSGGQMDMERIKNELSEILADVEELS